MLGFSPLSEQPLSSITISAPPPPPSGSTATLTVDGNGDITSGWVAEGGDFTRLQSDDGDTSRLYTPVNSAIRLVTFTNDAGYTGATITNVKLYAKVRSLDPVSNTFQIGVRIGGVNYFGATKDTVNVTTYVLFSETWTLNPATGVAWTPAEVDALQGGLSKINSVGMGWTYMYAEVEYTAGGGGGSTGQIKYYNGTAFVAKPVKVWTGSAWVTKPLKRYNGTTWVVTNY